ncbi:MAG: hypothetical protein OXC71_09820 [Chloroflexi bacterium]|nr:hypothetical protein [Chloroflexota bacterium]
MTQCSSGTFGPVIAALERFERNVLVGFGAIMVAAFSLMLVMIVVWTWVLLTLLG